MKRLSKWFYLGSIVGCQVIGIILLVVAIVILVLSGIFTNFVVNLSYAGLWAAVTSFLLILLGCAAILYGLSIWNLLLYRAWEAVQDGNARTTPQKAVGFIFIPFYNFYWVFIAWYGLARDYNRYIVGHKVPAPKMNEGLFLSFCILSICSAIPFLNYVAGLPFLVILALNTNEIVNGVNTLLAEQSGG